MFLKYVIEMKTGGLVATTTSIAIKYNVVDRSITIGGNGRSIEIIRNILLEYFNLRRLPPEVWIQRNKVRFTFRLKEGTRLATFIAELEENGFPIVEVPKLGRIMR